MNAHKNKPKVERRQPEKHFFSPLIEKVVVGVGIAMTLGTFTGSYVVYSTFTSLVAFAAEGERFTQEEFDVYNKAHTQDLKEYRADIKLELKEIKQVSLETQLSIARIESLMSKQLDLLKSQNQ